MVPSLILHVVGGQGVSRNVSFACRFPFQDFGECTETYVYGADAPKLVSAKQASVDSASFDLVAPEFGKRRAGSKKHIADASPGLGVRADVALVKEFLVGVAGHGREGNDKVGKGRRNEVSS